MKTINFRVSIISNTIFSAEGDYTLNPFRESQPVSFVSGTANTAREKQLLKSMGMIWAWVDNDGSSWKL